MLISVFPKKVGFTQGSKVLELEIGAYEWGPYNLTYPSQPAAAEIPIAVEASARLLSSIVGVLVLFCVFYM